MEADNIIGERLRLERERMDLTQMQAAELLETRNYILANYETGRTKFPPVDFLQRAATLYKCSLDYLAGRTNNRNEYVSDGIGPGIATRITRITRLSPDAIQDIEHALKWAEYEARKRLAQEKPND